MIADKILHDDESLAGTFSIDEAGAESGVPHIIVLPSLYPTATISTTFRLGGRCFSSQR